MRFSLWPGAAPDLVIGRHPIAGAGTPVGLRGDAARFRVAGRPGGAAPRVSSELHDAARRDS